MPRALANNDRAGSGSSGGRLRAFVADPACPCCDGCPLWTRIVQCTTGPACDGTPPPLPLEAWICSTVTCIDGRPLAAGMVFLLDGTCWIVQLEQQAVPPLGSIIVAGTDPVECVENCYDPRCPLGVLWLVARPCSSGTPGGFICGVTECGVYGVLRGDGGVDCYVVDPATGYIPGPALPPGARLLYPSSGPSPDCCSCGLLTDCIRCNLHQDVPEVLCCTSPDAILRIQEFRSLQLIYFGNQLAYRIEHTGSYVNASSFEFVVTRHRQAFSPPLGPGSEEDNTVEVFRGTFGGVGGCGWVGWPDNVYNILTTSWTFWNCTVGGAAAGFPLCGGGISGSCNTGTATCGSSYTYDCGRFAYNGSSQYDDPPAGRRYVETATVVASITDPAGAECILRCAGRALQAPKRSSSGCSGCGAGATTRI